MNCTIPNCKNRLTQAQVKYSYRVYNKGLCWDHQRSYDFMKKEEYADLKADRDMEDVYDINQEMNQGKEDYE